MPSIAVLHVTSAEGGGADRYIRDLAAATAARHWIWHAAAGVVEHAPAGRYYAAPADGPRLARWLASSGITLLHLHGVTQECAHVLERVRAAVAMPYVVTLHDIAFVAPGAFDGDLAPDAADHPRVAALLADAACVIVPSEYIGALVRQHFPGIAIECVAPGIGRAADAATVALPGIAADFHAGTRPTRIGIIGAIGPHKGSDDLAALGHALAACDASLVVIGYTDSRIEPGWVTPRELYVHGAYEEHQLPALLDAYGVGIVLFANRLPESFSYALSEAWAAGRPVIVPAAGALGERVKRLGGGWILNAGCSADDVAAIVARVTAAAGADEWAQVKSTIDTHDPLRIPPLATMTQAFDALYARFAQPADEADGDSGADALTSLVAANLDGRMFRRELVRATGELVGAHAWNTKLAADVAELKAAIERLERDNRVLAGVHAVFVRMPGLLQRYLLKRALRDRS